MCEGYMTYQWFPPDLCWKCPTGCQSCNAEVVNPGWKVTFGKEPKELSLNAGTVNLVSKKKKPYHSFCIQILGLHYLQRGTDVSKGLLFLVRLHGCLEYLIAHEKHRQRGVQNWPIFERPRMRVIEFSHVFFFLVAKLDPRILALPQYSSFSHHMPDAEVLIDHCTQMRSTNPICLQYW